MAKVLRYPYGMSQAKPMTMVRIETPTWARPFDVYLDGMKLSEYHRLQGIRDQILKLVHDEVVAYVNDDQLMFDGDEDWFPHRREMSGEYYIESESYKAKVGPPRVVIGVQCHCLQKEPIGEYPGLDYLGLHVWLECDREGGNLHISGNTDSSAI